MLIPRDTSVHEYVLQATSAEHAACNGAQFVFSPDESRFRHDSAKICVRIGAFHVVHRDAINQSLNSVTRRR